MVIEHVETFHAEGVDDAPSERGPDAGNQPRSEIARETFQCARREGDEAFRAKLLAVARIDDELTGDAHARSRSGRLKRSDHRKRPRPRPFTLERPDAEDTKARLLVFIGHSLDFAAQNQSHPDRTSTARCGTGPSFANPEFACISAVSTNAARARARARSSS